jgi:putative transcriptional regulator
LIRVKLMGLLEKQQLSQRELARRTGTHPDVISRFARGATTGVSYDLLDRICIALRCQPGDLLEFTLEQFTLFDERAGR